MTHKFTLPKDTKPGHKWQLVSGESVAQLTEFEGTEDRYPLRGVVNGDMSSWTLSGSLFVGAVSDDDLMDAPVTRTAWVNLYAPGFETQEKAKTRRGNDCIACIEVTYTEGDGL